MSMPQRPEALELPEELRGLDEESFSKLPPVPGVELLGVDDKLIIGVSDESPSDEDKEERDEASLGFTSAKGSDNETDCKDGYAAVISDSAFYKLPPIEALKLLARQSVCTSHKGVAMVWACYGSVIEELIKNGEHHGLAILQKYANNLVAFEAAIEGIVAGRSEHKTATADALITGLGVLIDDIKVKIGSMISEQTAHQKQTLSFVNQVNAASEGINRALKSAEDLHLEGIRRETTIRAPPPLSVPQSLVHLSTPIYPPSSDNETPSDVPDPAPTSKGTAVRTIQGDGKYANAYLMLTIAGDKVTGLSLKDERFSPLQAFVGKRKEFMLSFINRDMESLGSMLGHTPNWIPSPAELQDTVKRNQCLENAKALSVKYYQWFSLK